MQNKIAAVVVTYNRKLLLEKCIKHILEQSVQDVDVIIIDNASNDGTQEMVQKSFGDKENVQYVNTGSNLGGAGGFSFGIKWAVQHAYDYLWIMDDDTIPEKSCLEEFLNADKLLDGNYGFLSSYAKWIDNTPCEMNVPTISLKWRENIAEQFEHSIIRLESASFVSLFVKSEVVRKVGLPIKEFFIWGDDVEYTKRISRTYPGYFVYKSQVVHEMVSNKATSIMETEESRLSRFEVLYRNRYYMVKDASKREKMMFWIEIKNIVRDILKSDCQNKKKRVRIVLCSAWKGLSFNPQIEYID